MCLPFHNEGCGRFLQWLNNAIALHSDMYTTAEVTLTVGLISVCQCYAIDLQHYMAVWPNILVWLCNLSTVHRSFQVLCALLNVLNTVF